MMTLEDLSARGYEIHDYRDRIIIKLHGRLFPDRVTTLIATILWHPPLSFERARQIMVAHFVQRRLEGK